MAKIGMRDMIVVLPGITGSVLADDRGTLWDASVAAAWSYIRTLGGSIDRLVVTAHPPGADAPAGGVRATGLVQGIHGVFGLGRIDGYRALTKMINNNFDVVAAGPDPNAAANYIEFPYDWRLSNRTSARQLKAMVEARLPAWQRSPRGGREARLILIAHSMGGLVARYYLERLEGWQHCRALITFGTPYRGAVQAVDYLANGYKKALLDFTTAMRSMPSVYELLPIWRMLKDSDGWKRVAEVEGIPHIDAARARDALAFHREIEKAVKDHEAVPEYMANRYHVIPVIGVSQPTLQGARWDRASLSAALVLPDEIDPALAGGDGTVPRLSGTPIELSDAYRETFFAERHGSLQNNSYVLDDLCERLKQLQARGLKELRGKWSASALQDRNVISLDVDPLYLPGESVRLRARLEGGARPAGALRARVQLVQLATPAVAAPPGALPGAAPLERDFDEGPTGPELVLEELPPGSYRVRVWTATGGPLAATPVTEVFDVAGAD